MRWIVIAMLIGVTGCVAPSSDVGVCLGLEPPVKALSKALTEHPETPDPVGEAGTDVVVGYRAGCPVK